MRDMSEEEYKNFLYSQGFDFSGINLFYVSSGNDPSLFDDYTSGVIDYIDMFLLEAEDYCISGSGKSYVNGLAQGALRGSGEGLC